MIKKEVKIIKLSPENISYQVFFIFLMKQSDDGRQRVIDC